MAMTKGLPAEISEFLVNALESHDQKLQSCKSKKAKKRFSWLLREEDGQLTITSLCGKEKRTSKEKIIERGKVGGNRFFTAQYYWLIPPPQMTHLMNQPLSSLISISKLGAWI
jgi:hypothetical protein